tara:strand:- start:2060 stop:2251 length:192 start_codon:yes stop_codon:yes gene_type:complete
VYFTACQHNLTFGEIYPRITHKGKSKKLVLMAVCDKLLKQDFAISQSNLPNNKDYLSTLKKVI